MDLCGAKTKSGGTCGHEAGWGTSHVGAGHCKQHGGASPNGEQHGAAILARRELVVMGRPVDIEPHEALLECIRIAAGEVAYCSDRIARLDAEEAAAPVVTTTRRKIEPLNLDGEEQDDVEPQEAELVETKLAGVALNVWIAARHQAMDRLANYAKVAIGAGIAERQVQIAERQGALLAEAIRAILGELGVADHPKAPEVVRRQLSLVAGSGARPAVAV